MRPGIVLAACLVAASAFAQTSPIVKEHDVTNVVGGMLSDRLTWYDASGQPRVAVLAHNNPSQQGFVVGPGGSNGGELREFHYQVSGQTRIVAASSKQTGGFGYVVSHPYGTEACVGGHDSSSFGHFTSGTWTRVFEGRHHVIFRFQQNYPRYCTTGAAAENDLPVTIDWVFSTGRDNPLWAITYDLSGLSGANVLNDDSRAPYGELMFDGSTDPNLTDTIGGVAWGDGNKFTSLTVPVTMDSDWDWSQPNTVPYVKLWMQNADATMGIVQTQTLAQQDAGGYFDATPWGTTSAGFGKACGPALVGPGNDHKMPCDFNWDYQSINYEFADNSTPTNSPRLAWGTEFGFLGQSSYPVNGNHENWGGPYSMAMASGYPLPSKKKSYSTYVVLGTNSSGPVEAQVAQIENIQSLGLTASIGSVLTGGAGGVNRTVGVNDPAVTYAPAGYNHVYGALAFSASNNLLDANISVGNGTLNHPLIIVSGYTGVFPPIVKFNGTALTSDVDYFASQRTSPNELWITLNRNLAGAANDLQLGVIASGDFSGDSRNDLVLRNYSTGQDAIWIMNGTSLSSIVDLPALPNTSYRFEGTADFSGDGKPDIVLRNMSTGQDALWIMNGTSLSSIVDLPALPNTNYHFQGTGDFNHDGHPDIMLRNYSTGQDALWIMNGTSLSMIVDLPALPNTNYQFAGAADFNGDGNIDIVLRNYVTGQNALWLMNGTSLSTIVDLPALPNTSYRIDAVGDFNGDGKPDIVWRNYSTGQNAVWIMNGTSLSMIVDLPALPNTNYQFGGPR